MKSFTNKKNLYIEKTDHYEIHFSNSSQYYKDGETIRKIRIDKDDLNKCLEYNWCAVPGKHTVYASAYAKDENGKRNAIRMHNLILNRCELFGFKDDGKVIDHRNKNGCDNRKKNLRIASLTTNQVNSNMPKNNTSGAKGVSYNKVKNHWLVQFSFGSPRFQYTRTFTVSKFKDSDEAFHAAVQFRKDLEVYIGYSDTDVDFDTVKARKLLEELKAVADPVGYVKQRISS